MRPVAAGEYLLVFIIILVRCILLTIIFVKYSYFYVQINNLQGNFQNYTQSHNWHAIY